MTFTELLAKILVYLSIVCSVYLKKNIEEVGQVEEKRISGKPKKKSK